MYGEDIDLSFRLLKGGWQNWYLPYDIIHYKGESTQKSSFRYVHVFYQAMLIFFRKHYGHLSFLLSIPIKAAIYFRAENDRSLWDVGTTNVPYSRYTLHDYIATSSDDIFADRQVRLIIEDVRTRKTVGICDLVRFDPQHQRAETGIVVMRDNRRKGYALTALTLLADYALRVVHLHQLYAVVAADNEAAVNLFRKAGYEVQAELRDWLFDGHQYGNALLMQRFL